MSTRMCTVTVLTLAIAVGCTESDDETSGHDSKGSVSGSTSSQEETSHPGGSTGQAPGNPDDDTGGNDPSGGDTDPPPPPLCGPEALQCIDEMILDLGLNEVVTSGEVSNTRDGEDWLTFVDATAGGLPNQATNPWVYLRFTPSGAQRVDIDDLEALDSEVWHIAVKRFGIRVNSGVSGPSCVGVAALPIGTYDAIEERPDEDAFAFERFYDEGCNLLSDEDDDGGFLSPPYLLRPWWSYPGCVATTLQPFVLELPEGTAIKLLIEAYYGMGQETCNSSGVMGQEPANFTWRWKYLD